MSSVARKVVDPLRWGLALWALLASAALAAPIETIAVERAPVQLSLPFAAAPSAALLPTSALTAAPALAAPSLPTAAFVSPLPAVAAAPAAAAAESAAHWSAMPPAVAQAFRSGDARAFWEACRQADFAPPQSDDAQQNLLHEGAQAVEADRLALARFAPAVPPVPAPVRARATKIDYDAFARALALRPGLSGDIFRDSGSKRAILKAAGYARLHASGGRRVAIDEASDARVGRAFAATLRAYRNRSR